MRILHATDLHGSERLFQAILELAAAEQPRVLLLGGDLYRNSKPWREDARAQRAFVDGVVTKWLEQLHGAVPELEVFAIPGNHEWREAVRGYEVLAASGLLHDLHLTWRRVDDLVFYGYGCTPPSVFPTKDYERWDVERGVSHTGCGSGGYVTDPRHDDGRARKVNFKQYLDKQPTMAEELGTLTLPEPEPGVRHVLLSHCPPWDTDLDHMWGDRPIGSQAILAHLETHRPAFSFHGHVHEAPEVTGHYWQQLGDTLAVNPGRASQGLAAALLDTDAPGPSLRHTLLGPATATRETS